MFLRDAYFYDSFANARIGSLVPSYFQTPFPVLQSNNEEMLRIAFQCMIECCAFPASSPSNRPNVSVRPVQSMTSKFVQHTLDHQTDDCAGLVRAFLTSDNRLPGFLADCRKNHSLPHAQQRINIAHGDR